MKDRILTIMKREGMTQQQFSHATGLPAASLSSIFTGRTSPTLKHAEALHRRFPNLSMSWLLFGDGEMFVDQNNDGATASADSTAALDPFAPDPVSDSSSTSPSTLPMSPSTPSSSPVQTEINFQQGTFPPASHHQGAPLSLSTEQLAAAGVYQQMSFGYMKNTDIKPRKIAEIRIFFDDGTFEVFPGNS